MHFEIVNSGVNLGTTSYVKHEGSKPMNITWKLDTSISTKYLKKTNKLVV